MKKIGILFGMENTFPNAFIERVNSKGEDGIIAEAVTIDKVIQAAPNEYAVIIEPLSEEDGGGYLARVPELPGCMSDGETPEEAVTNVQDAILAWIEAANDLGHEVPKPGAFSYPLWPDFPSKAAE